VPSLKGLLVNATGWNVDREADVAPIRYRIEIGCDLEADILPVVGRLVPELKRPLKSWGAQWLVQEIIAVHEQRLGLSSLPKASAVEAPVEAPPPAKQAFEAAPRTARASSNGTRRGSRGGEFVTPHRL
jgi:hypothetical protein